MRKLTELSLVLKVNGEVHRLKAHPLRRVLDVLREDLGLTGTKEGCGEGECGACMVLLEGRPVLSCLLPACHADGKSLTTIEGLARDGQLHPLQEAFLREGGAQCGICTPGMILSAAYYVAHPDVAEDLREALAGNQCRCTGYARIFEAVAKAMEKP